NNNLTYIILTNTRDFYIINAQEYLQFTKHKEIIKAFNNCENKKGNDTSTQKFYDEIKSILPKIKSNLKFTHFCLDETSLNDASALALIYQVLSPAMLLKHKTHIDSNTLNQSFYNELLYILGLEEKTQNSKVLIEPSKVSNTLLDSLCSALNFQRDKDFETIFALLTTWNNRLLFLRLLESMLLGFKHITKPFLDLETLESFSSLNTLFFDVLAKAEESRDANLSTALKAIPYLNSSLFERSVLEKQGKEIKLLESKPLILYKDSILYKDKELFKLLNLKDKDSTLPLLEYLFAFLRAYDFTTTPKDIHNHTKINFDKLINAAVLGLVFEKLNGYKEGSFYTPSFITSYMCKQSLEKVVLQKFNSAKNWDCKDLDSLKTKLDKLTDSKEGYKEANKIFDSIHICDPAVGSGHFLVSALNELILLKFKFGILCDWNFNRIKDISLELQNDEIVIRDSHNALFAYTLPAHEDIESHKIQKALFHNKRTLIESCLFGVDINPNSCEITKLRLWIELLKYSYYKDIQNKRLETLPNIDINIKCGNSLISHFDTYEYDKQQNPQRGTFAWLKKQDSTFSKNFKEKLLRYNELVQIYKEKLGNKQDIDKEIHSLKTFFKDTLLNNGYTMESLEKNLGIFVRTYGDECFDMETPFGMEMIRIIRKKNLKFQPTLEELEPKPIEKKGQDLLALIHKEFNTLESLRQSDTFEWRFAFPEVLDLETFEEKQKRVSANNAIKAIDSKENKQEIKDTFGDFLGFDIVIGNPPYIKEADNKKLFDGTRDLRTYQGKMDIWYHFVGLGFDIVKNKGIVTFIATNNWTTNAGAKNLRNVILTESQILNLVDFGSYMCFDAASIQTMVMEFQKRDSIPESYQINYARIDSKNPTDSHREAILKRESFEDNIYLEPNITPSQMLDKSLTFADSKQEEVLNKILENGTFYLRDDEVWQGLVHPQPYLDKKMINLLEKESKFNYQVGNGVFNLNKREIELLSLNTVEKSILKPYYEANNLLKYYGIKETNIYVIYTDSKFNKANSMDKYPNLKKHLDNLQSVITSCNKPYGLHRSRKQAIFEGEKILSRVKCVDFPVFTYVNFPCYVGLNFNIIKTERINLKYLVGILNSKPITFWLRHKGKMQGNNYQINQEPLLNIPLIEITKQNEKNANQIIALVDEILKLKAKDSTFDTSKLELQIDKLVYKLYDLTDEEIQIIES
ncbi:type IIG restriction enzyme/methyltransferase, partial [Helicobacter japonicus]